MHEALSYGLPFLQAQASPPPPALAPCSPSGTMPCTHPAHTHRSPPAHGRTCSYRPVRRTPRGQAVPLYPPPPPQKKQPPTMQRAGHGKSRRQIEPPCCWRGRRMPSALQGCADGALLLCCGAVPDVWGNGRRLVAMSKEAEARNCARQHNCCFPGGRGGVRLQTTVALWVLLAFQTVANLD